MRYAPKRAVSQRETAAKPLIKWRKRRGCISFAKSVGETLFGSENYPVRLINPATGRTTVDTAVRSWRAGIITRPNQFVDKCRHLKRIAKHAHLGAEIALLVTSSLPPFVALMTNVVLPAAAKIYWGRISIS